jgi:hypothetical protein
MVVSTAPTYNQVRGIVWKEIRRAHVKGKLRGRINMNCEWLVGDELVAIGRKPADHRPEAFSGVHARYVLVIIDEASGVPASLWTGAETLLSNAESKLIAIGNPDDPNSEFAKVCKPGSGYNVITISAFDTPAFTGEYVPEDVAAVLVSELWVQEREKKWNRNGQGDSPLYMSKVLAEFPKSSPYSLISLADCEKARALDLTTPGEYFEKVFGVDVARYGSDETVIYLIEGPKARLVQTYAKQDTMTTASEVYRLAKEQDVGAVKIDVIGVGAGVFDRVVEMATADKSRMRVIPMSGSDRAQEPERFVNARAEWFWTVKERLEEERADLDPDDEDLVAQLSDIRWKSVGGRIQIESKDDMRRRGLPSPDRADALVLGFAPEPLFEEDEVYEEYEEVEISPY